MSLRALLARQLGRPSGIAALLMGRTLNRVNARVNALALERLALQPADRLIDVGFGGALLLQAAADRVGFAAGIDISEPMVSRARRLLRKPIRAGRVEIREGSVSAIPYPDGAFSKAVTINTLHFWPDSAAGCRELARVLVPGGQLVLAVRPKAYLERIAFTEHGFKTFDDDSLRALLLGAGFSEVRVEQHEDADRGIVLAIARISG